MALIYSVSRGLMAFGSALALGIEANIFIPCADTRRLVFDVTKSLKTFIFGVLLIGAGALVHSHAEDWSYHTIQTTLSNTGSMEAINYPVEYLFQDLGLAMMGIGAIAFTLGLVAYLYPPREN